MQNNRPIRLSLENFQGKRVSLSSGPAAFLRLDAGSNNCTEHIILGLGPTLYEADFKESLPNRALFDASQKIYFLECSDFTNALEKKILHYIPSHWQELTKAELFDLLRAKRGIAIWWYRQNVQFFPEFWADILGNVQALILREGGPAPQASSVIIAGSERQLLHSEVCTAFAELGFNVHNSDLRTVIEHERPQLFFSINLRGLDAEGADFELLHALNIPAVLWFVDNPWHILSSLRLPWWKKANIFVTDASFIPALKEQGAKFVYHLPLAASQHMGKVEGKHTWATQVAEAADCIFVGRASFPEHDKFFAAARVNQDHMDEAIAMLQAGKKPHFHWWHERVQQALWPGYAVRSIGLSAEQCACRQRVIWLKSLLNLNSAIFGDADNWRNFLPEAGNIFYPALDYYTELGEVYAAAKCVLNVTSLLLPEGLTQRHFDVWAAGGFLFTDITGGLDIFPKDLTKFIGIAHPNELESKIKNLSAKERTEIIEAWQELILGEHNYAKRMTYVLNVIS